MNQENLSVIESKLLEALKPYSEQRDYIPGLNILALVYYAKINNLKPLLSELDRKSLHILCKKKKICIYCHKECTTKCTICKQVYFCKQCIEKNWIQHEREYH